MKESLEQAMKQHFYIQRFIWVFVLLLALSSASSAETNVNYHFSGGYYGESRSGEAMVLDAILIRPKSHVLSINQTKNNSLDITQIINIFDKYIPPFITENGFQIKETKFFIKIKKFTSY